VVGDALSIFYRSNSRNYELLQKHAGKAKPASKRDWIFVFGLLGVAGLVVIVFFVGLFYILHRLWVAMH
jgi:hypothetical protein